MIMIRVRSQRSGGVVHLGGSAASVLTSVTLSVGALEALRVHLENVGGYWSRSGIPRLQLRSNRVHENYLSWEGETGGGRKSEQTTYKRVPAGATLMSLFALF